MGEVEVDVDVAPGIDDGHDRLAPSQPTAYE